MDMSHFDIGSMDLNTLKVFEALYEEGSATRAAVRLGLTQSAVSASLARLRITYRNQLFTRTGRGLSATLRAHELRPFISDALEKCRQSLLLGDAGNTAHQGRSIAIGLSDDFEIALGRQLIDAVAARLPGLRLAFRQTHSQIVGDMLQDRQIDLALVSGGLSSRQLKKQSVARGRYACLADQSRSGADAHLTLDDYVDRDHLLVSAGGFVGIVDEVLDSLGRQRRVVASTNHFSALACLLPGTAMIATLPWHAAVVIAEQTRLSLLACPLPLPGFAIELGSRTDALHDAAVSDTRQVLLERIESHCWT